MGANEPCHHCIGGKMVDGGEITLEDGSKDRVIYCYKCGAIPRIPPKCPKPHVEPLDNAARRERKITKDRPRKYQRVPCVNCGRILSIQAKGLCFFCYTHQDNLEDAKWLVDNGMITQGRGPGNMRIVEPERAEVR